MIPAWLLACQFLATGIGESDDAAAPMVPVAVFRYGFDSGVDLDLDGAPDDWVRRRGPEFPRYVKAGLDRAVGRSDPGSLRIQANGGAVAYYSPLVRIDGTHTFYFEGYIRTEGLKYDAALLSVSLLNPRRQRVQRILSRPVAGDHDEWVRVRLGPIVPDADVRFAVVGCHLAPGSGDQHDIQGQVWFDDLSFGRLPRLDLESHFLNHFLNEDAPIRITARVGGLDEGYLYQLDLKLQDRSGRVVAETSQQLTPQRPPATVADSETTESVQWELLAQPPGFYRVTASLKRDDITITTQQTTLTVLRLMAGTRPRGEFGWSLNHAPPARVREELPQVAAQAGINWIKYPLWRSMEAAQAAAQAGQVAALFDRLRTQGIEPIGVLSEPPDDLRNKFASQWLGVAEVFRLPPSVWRKSLEPVIARFSSTVNYWQLGGELDASFEGIPDLSRSVNSAVSELRRISLNSAVGLPWMNADTLPTDVRAAFWSTPFANRSVAAAAADTGQTADRWLLLQPALLTGRTVDERAGQLARWMVAAKMTRAPAIFVNDVYHPTNGLLRLNGSPAELFLPWRTCALALQGAEYLGSLPLPNGSQNAVFVRDQEAVVVVWNDEPVTESLYFGEQPLEMDLWGRTRPLQASQTEGEQRIDIEPIPKLIVGGSAPIARWRVAARFESGKMRSEYGGHSDAIVGVNTFPQGVSGTVSLILPREWEADAREWPIHVAAGQPFRFPVTLTAPPHTPLGEHPVTLEFRITGDRPYRFLVPTTYTIGLGDVALEVHDRKLPDGRLEIEQIVTNQTSPPETLDFRCSLFVPDMRRHKLQITKLEQGQDRKLYYLPDAERFRGQTLLLRLEQDGGRRILNYRWTVGEDWERN